MYESSNAAMNQRAAGNLAGAVAPKPISQMQLHAEMLAGISQRLFTLNSRLSSLADRLSGPVPASPTTGKDEAAPPAVLLVAQFEARRIDSGLEWLTDTINRLEQVA